MRALFSRANPLLLALALFTLAACGGETDEVPESTPSASAAEGTTGRMEDGVQVFDIEAGTAGYAPRSVTLQAQVPARLVFTRTVDSACSSQVQIPEFGIPVTDLPLGEPVAIEFTPTESGTFEFVCGMDMQRGALLIPS